MDIDLWQEIPYKFKDLNQFAFSKKYLKLCSISVKAEDDSLEVEMATLNEEEQYESAIGDSSGKRDKIHSICLLPIRLSVY